MGPCQELFGGVYGNIDIFFNKANCLGLARTSSATGTINGTTTSPTLVPFKGTASTNGVQRGLWVGIIVFQCAIGWVIVNM